MVKILDGKELAGFIKERQAHLVKILRSQKKHPRLVIVRDSENPVITKYVNLKCAYGNDIGIEVVDEYVKNPSLEVLRETVKRASEDETVSGIIVQLPLTNTDWTEAVVNEITPEKDVDGLADYDGKEDKRVFDSATATAINWLLVGHNIELSGKKIAIVGRGKLVGAPLTRMWINSGFDVEVFHRGSDFSKLKDFDVIVTATVASIGTAGVPGAGVVMLAMVLQAVGLPVDGIALVLGVDRIFDMGRTVVNITGDAVCAYCVSKSVDK